jgi:hypothetical protein
MLHCAAQTERQSIETDKWARSTVYDIMKPTGVNYIGFMAWIGM